MQTKRSSLASRHAATNASAFSGVSSSVCSVKQRNESPRASAMARISRTGSFASYENEEWTWIAPVMVISKVAHDFPEHGHGVARIVYVVHRGIVPEKIPERRTARRIREAAHRIARKKDGEEVARIAEEMPRTDAPLIRFRLGKRIPPGEFAIQVREIRTCKDREWERTPEPPVHFEKAEYSRRLVFLEFHHHGAFPRKRFEHFLRVRLHSSIGFDGFFHHRRSSGRIQRADAAMRGIREYVSVVAHAFESVFSALDIRCDDRVFAETLVHRAR